MPRCHNHKFDPITQEDYYSLQAVFAGAGKGDVEFDEDPVVASQRRRWNELLQPQKHGEPIVALAPEYADIVARWEQNRSGTNLHIWEPLVPTTFLSSDGTTLKLLEDNSLLASDVRPDKDTYTITVSTSLTKLTALRLDVLADDSLPMKGPGRQDNGNLHLTEFEVFVLDAEAAEPTRLKISKATADWNQADWTISHALDGDLTTAWGILSQSEPVALRGVRIGKALRATKPSSQLVIRLKQLHGAGHLIGRLKLYATDATGATAEVLPEEIRSALNLPHDQRSEEQQAADRRSSPCSFMLSSNSLRCRRRCGVRGVEQPLARKETRQPNATESRARAAARRHPQTWSRSSRRVLCRPSRRCRLDLIWMIRQNEASRRAALADWLAAPDNPLTWRSVVNRVWSYHFGRGLCDTPNDFGRMGGIAFTSLNCSIGWPSGFATMPTDP